MPLPKLESQKFTCIVPSTNKEIEYRPFLVKEERVLMQVQETNDASAVLRVIKDVITACTFNELKVNDLTTYDLEYVFLQLRSKSVGEIAHLKFKCEECGHFTEVDVNLDEVKVQYPEKKIESNIKLSENVGITLKPIGVDSINAIDEKDADAAFMAGITATIDTVYDENGVYKLNDFSQKEISDFIDSLSHKQLEKIQDNIQNQPKVSHTVTYKCASCGHENTVVIEGLQSFFT